MRNCGAKRPRRKFALEKSVKQIESQAASALHFNDDRQRIKTFERDWKNVSEKMKHVAAFTGNHAAARAKNFDKTYTSMTEFMAKHNKPGSSKRKAAKELDSEHEAIADLVLAKLDQRGKKRRVNPDTEDSDSLISKFAEKLIDNNHEEHKLLLTSRAQQQSSAAPPVQFAQMPWALSPATFPQVAPGFNSFAGST
eukprot:m.342102 g.342102  ORF g.342102 m.342102 type:complete len:196 (-) comp16545_c0_seq67:7631-8218(-)